MMLGWMVSAISSGAAIKARYRAMWRPCEHLAAAIAAASRFGLIRDCTR
jgi:hypothetical protein